MRRVLLAALAVSLSWSVAHAQQTPPPPAGLELTPPGSAPPAGLESLEQRVSYLIGTNIGRSLKTDGVKIDLQLLIRGLTDAMEDKPLLLNDEQARATMIEFQQKAMAAENAERAALGEKNKQDGAAFLAKNKLDPQVVTRPSGLQYKVLTQGTGASPKLTDQVTVHYRGTLLDGTEFDSSYKRNEPATFGVGEVIGGWTEALQLMKVGDKWQLFIPSDLAYGPEGRGPVIPPNAMLVFEVELLAVGGGN